MSPRYHITVDMENADFPECLKELAGFKIVRIELVEDK